MLETYLGTKGHALPEILKRKSYKGEHADLFSLGVTIFKFLTTRAPFNEAKESDAIYRFYINR